jgi:hypothetical protein
MRGSHVPRGNWTKWAVTLGLTTALLVGILAAPSFGAGYQLNGLGSGCTEPGNSNTVHGNKFDVGSDVSIVLGGQVIGVVQADAGGNVSGSFAVPAGASTGTTSLKLEGSGPDGARTLSFELKVGGCSESQDVSGGAASEGSGGGSGTLAFTGGDTGMTVGIAAAVLVVGVAFVVAARKRRAGSEAS